MEIDGERDVEPEATAQLVELSARAEDRPLGGPDALRCAELDGRVPLAHLEHAGGHEPVTDAAGEAVDGGADVDRAAELVEQRLVLGRLEHRQRLDLFVASHQPGGHPGRLERRGALGNVRPADENALPSEQSRAELALEPLPLSPRPNRKPNKPLIVMSMPKDPCAARRLPRPRSGGLEANELNTAPLERIGRREPGDPTADDGDFCCRGAHGRPCIPPRLESHREGQ